MSAKNQHIKDRIIESALPAIPFDGWSDDALQNSAAACGYDAGMARAVFPDGVTDAVSHFADMADRVMANSYNAADTQELKVREKIARAVWARFEYLAEHKEAERLAVAFWMRPMRKFKGAKIVWNTADVIWTLAGDTATDYNRYTKRVLLSGILTATTLYWLNDESPSHIDSRAFLDRRIDNALSIGRIAGKLKRA